MMRFSNWLVVLVLASCAAAPVAAHAQAAAPAPAATAPQNVIAEVRAAIAKGDFAGGEQVLAAYRKTARSFFPVAAGLWQPHGRGKCI